MPFLKRLGIGLAALAALMLLGLIGGVFWEPAAIATILVGIGATLALALVGQVWFIAIGFAHSVGYGLGTLLVPLFWAVLLAKQVGRSQQALAVVISAVVPALLTMATIAATAPQHSPQWSRSRQRARLSAKADRFIEVIHRHEAEHPLAAKPQVAAYRCPLRVKDPAAFLAEGERLLTQFKAYQPGSLQLNETATEVSFEHRGTAELAEKYRLYLASKTGVILAPLPPR